MDNFKIEINRLNDHREERMQDRIEKAIQKYEASNRKNSDRYKASSLGLGDIRPSSMAIPA